MDDTNDNAAEMVSLISELGPDVPEISRRTGQYRESVRYRYRAYLLSRGMAIQAVADHEMLGLRRVVSFLRFSDEYREYAETILAAMSDACYLVTFERTLPEGSYIVNSSVPTEFVQDFFELTRSLKAKGLFTEVEVHDFDAVRVVPMKSEKYNFARGAWDFDWSASLPRRRVKDSAPSKRGKFDYIDLLLIKELQSDATRSMVEVASKLKVNYKTLVFHWTNHVKARGLVKGYSVNWMGTRYEQKLEKALHRKHKYLRVNLFVECKSEGERMRLGAKANTVPFLWAEAWGKDYYAEFAFPLDFVNEAMSFLAEMLEGFHGRARYFVMDQTHALSFTVGYRLFDQTAKVWRFDRNQLVESFGNLILKIREGAQPGKKSA